MPSAEDMLGEQVLVSALGELAERDVIAPLVSCGYRMDPGVLPEMSFY